MSVPHRHPIQVKIPKRTTCVLENVLEGVLEGVSEGVLEGVSEGVLVERVCCSRGCVRVCAVCQC